MLDTTLWVMAVVLFFGLIVPEFFKKFQLPFATSLIILGSVLGPNGLNYIQSNDFMDLFGFLGATFLMLLSGFEVRTAYLKKLRSQIVNLFTLNSFIPFLIGGTIVKLFGYPWETALVTGVLFMSSSIALIFSNLKFLKQENTILGRTLKGSVAFEDLASLLLLSLLIQYITPTTRFPLIIYLGLLISSVIILRMFLPEVIGYFFSRFSEKDDEYEGRLRVVITFFLFVLIIYSSMDVHPIIAAFLVGFVLSEVRGTKPLLKKLHTIGYGIFVPIFFFIVGVQIDFTTVEKMDINNWLMITLVAGALLSKILSGYLAGRLSDFSNHESLTLGVATSIKLTTTISASYAVLLLDLIDQVILTSIVIVSIVSTLIGPPLMNFLAGKIKRTSYA